MINALPVGVCSTVAPRRLYSTWSLLDESGPIGLALGEICPIGCAAGGARRVSSERMTRECALGTWAIRWAPWMWRLETSLTKDGMAMNPFEDPDAMYLVLVNDEGQHSLWPVFVDVPDGWNAVFGEAGREECLDYIEKSWTDMRPKSLIAAMEKN